MTDDERLLELKRIRWRSRRGLLEMDLVLTQFLECYLDKLSPAELSAYVALLEVEDNTLLDYVNKRDLPEDAMQQYIVSLWQSIRITQ